MIKCVLILSWTYEVFKSFFFFLEMKREDWPSLKWLMSGSIYFVLRNGGGKKNLQTLMNNSTFTFFLFHSFLLSKRWHRLQPCYPDLFNKHCFNPFISVISIFQHFTVFIWSYCILCSVTPCTCVWQKSTRTSLLFSKNCGNTLWVPHDGRLMGSFFFFFFSPSEWGRGVEGVGGVCARDGEQWPNCWAATRLSPEDFLLNSGPPNSVWHATSWGEETRIIKKQREGDWGEPLMPSRLSQTLVRSPLERKKKEQNSVWFLFF